jgi:hypothetical protein
MRLKVCASCPISSWYSTTTRLDRSLVVMMPRIVSTTLVRGRMR